MPDIIGEPAALSDVGVDMLSEWNVVADSQKALRAEVALEREATVLAAGDFKAVLSVVAPPVDNTARAPLRLVAVLDKSGSMNGEKLRLVQKTMLFMLRHLSEQDALSIVEYDTQVSVAAPLTFCNATGRARLEASLKRLRAGTQTNLSGGLLKGLKAHCSAAQEASSAQQQASLQQLSIGNTYRRLSEEEAKEHVRSDGTVQEHEWTMAVRFKSPEDEALVQKVVFDLHPTFRQATIEVLQAPFQLTRMGWGTFQVVANVCLHDGRAFKLEHMLAFGPPETFRTELLPLRSLPEGLDCAPASPAAPQDAEQAVVRSTFLFTDGLANVGITKSPDLCEAAQAALGELGDDRCTVSTFGFGKDHNADLLQGLAEVGGGVYSFVEDEDKIGESFGEALGGLLSTTHQNVCLSLELAPGVGFSKAFTSYPLELPGASSGGSCAARIDIGDVFAEERRDILVALTLPQVAADGPEMLGQLRVEGFSVSGKRTETAAPVNLMVQRQAAADLAAPVHDQIERHRLRHAATEALEAGRAAAQRGDLAGARRLLTAAVEALSTSRLTASGDAACLGLLADLKDCFTDLQHEATYMASGSKKMACMQGAHTRQRAVTGSGSAETYTNTAMMSMKAVFKANCQ
mmetsp:Transcript_67647/g.174284  ORF Transcript_67647/g.174284 Transcript_67647/m.174284 type:complete len:633 (+) Transcript_67647:74-1972(+)